MNDDLLRDAAPELTCEDWRTGGDARLGIVLVAVAFATLATTAAGQSQERATTPADSTVTHWTRLRAIAIPSADEPYADSSYAFLPPLVGSARVLALGEQHHCGHEPLEFRNHVVRYAVTHLGFTSLAVESGFTEAGTIERFIQGGRGNVDSVVRSGFTWQFGGLRENRELVLWLRQRNASATRKVHFYGLDLTGAEDTVADVYNYPGASKAVLAALDYMARVSPGTGAALSSRLLPLMNRFTLSRYQTYSAAERGRVKAGLEDLYQKLSVDSARDVRASSIAEHARALRNAWMALQMNDIVAGKLGRVVSPRNGNLRDSIMAENAAWVLTQTEAGGHVIVFAHDGHVMSAPLMLPTLSPDPIPMLGQRLRRRLHSDMVIMASTTSKTVGFGESPVDSHSLDAALAPVGPNFIVDLRRSDSVPEVAALLKQPWPFRFAAATGFLSKVPRDAADVIVYFAQVTATPTAYAPVACNG